MRHKNKPQSDKTSEREALEKHVDAMMDPKLPDPPADGPNLAAAFSSAPTIASSDAQLLDIAAITAEPSAPPLPTAEPSTDTRTAPQLSPKLRKQITVNDTPTKPLSIDKLDELTKQITAEDDTKKSKKPKKNKAAAEPADQPETVEADNQELGESSTDLNDKRTDEAVDDIMAYESDVMLAVADSTAEARNQETISDTPHKKHHALSTFFWGLITFVVLLIIVLGVLLVMGDSLTSKLGI